MSTITFFHNERIDGARRTGLVVDGRRLWERFAPGNEDRDPALRWYVDVIWESSTPPETEQKALKWIADQCDTLHTVLNLAADQLSSGIDADAGPWEKEFVHDGNPVRVSLSAVRVLSGQTISQSLREIPREVHDCLQSFGLNAPVG